MSDWSSSCQRSLRSRWGCHITTLYSIVVADIVIELARENVLSKLLYADDLFLKNETIEVLRNKGGNGRRIVKVRAL